MLPSRHIQTPPARFARAVAGVGHFQLHPLLIPEHMPLIHDWAKQNYARYWGMQEASLDDVASFYRELENSDHTQAYLGFHEGAPAFLLECYAPGKTAVGEHYPVQAGDRGMHFLVAPADTPIPNFTLGVMTVIMDFLFSDPGCDRVVVEPDARNEKIHVLNRRAGFVYERLIDLPEKTAHLAFCTKDQFINALPLQHR
jgi:hypothetical protein